MDPEVQRLEERKVPVEIQMTEVSAVDIVQQVAQQLAPLVAAIPEVEAGLQREQAGPAGDQMVRVVMNPGLPPLKLPVRDQQPLLAEVEDAAA